MSKSILTEYEDISVFSGTPTKTHHHLVYGRGIRPLADQDGLWIPVLDSEHNMSSKGTIFQIHGNPRAEDLSKMLGQVAWEKQYILEKSGLKGIEIEAREMFRKRYGKSFL